MHFVSKKKLMPISTNMYNIMEYWPNRFTVQKVSHLASIQYPSDILQVYTFVFLIIPMSLPKRSFPAQVFERQFQNLII